MAKRELRLERLLNRRVYALDGRSIGRLEEVRVEPRKDALYIVEYRVGTYALLERLAGSPIGRSILRTLRLARRGGGYRVPWNKLDLSNEEQPRLRCDVRDLLPLEDEA